MPSERRLEHNSLGVCFVDLNRVSWVKLLDNMDWRDVRLIMQVNVGQTPEVRLAAGLSDHSSWIVVRIKDVCYHWHSFNIPYADQGRSKMGW